MACNQCGKPAIYQLEGHPLCLGCYERHQRLLMDEQVQNAAMINYLKDSMQYSVFGGVPPRIEIPKPTIQVGRMTNNNIRVDNSVVGVINTGEVDKIQVTLENIRAGGNADVADALKRLTEAVLASRALPDADKKGAVEHVSYLADQAARPPDQRQRATSKSVIEGLERSLSVAADVYHVWKAVAPLIAAVLGVPVDAH